MNAIQIEKTYWASVSGGKDSLKMLHIILENPQKYPLNGIVHWKLEIDYDFVSFIRNYQKNWEYRIMKLNHGQAILI